MGRLIAHLILESLPGDTPVTTAIVQTCLGTVSS